MKKKWMVIGAAVVLVASLAVAGMAAARDSKSGATKVTVQLKWVTQAQFAGYYAAKELGYYNDQCLDVTIVEGGVDIVPQTELAQGNADYAIAWVPKALASREQGAGITNVATTLSVASGDGAKFPAASSPDYFYLTLLPGWLGLDTQGFEVSTPWADVWLSADDWAEVMAECAVIRLMKSGDRVTGAHAIRHLPDGTTEKLEICAEHVFVCGGAIQTPALLQRSGIRGRLERRSLGRPRTRFAGHDIPNLDPST